MPSDAKLLALVGVLHLVMLVLAGIMLFLFIRSDTNGTWPPRPDEGEGGGGGANWKLWKKLSKSRVTKRKSVKKLKI